MQNHFHCPHTALTIEACLVSNGTPHQILNVGFVQCLPLPMDGFDIPFERESKDTR